MQYSKIDGFIPSYLYGYIVDLLTPNSMQMAWCKIVVLSFLVIFGVILETTFHQFEFFDYQNFYRHFTVVKAEIISSNMQNADI